jgi:hypothetical protein
MNGIFYGVTPFVRYSHDVLTYHVVVHIVPLRRSILHMPIAVTATGNPTGDLPTGVKPFGRYPAGRKH